MKMTESIIEEPGSVNVDVSQPLTEDFTTPKKKKKRDKIVDVSASLDIESSSPGENVCSTPLTSRKKKKKKHENVDDDDLSESTKRKTLDMKTLENEMHITDEEKGDTEEYNTSVIENESFVASHKKKKKKKFENVDDDDSISKSTKRKTFGDMKNMENEINIMDEEKGDTEGYNTSVIEKENFVVSHKKKKKKKKYENVNEDDLSESTNRKILENVKNLENEIHIMDEEKGDTEGYNTSVIENESFVASHKKKKKKNKASIDEAQTDLVYEDGEIEGCNNNMVDDKISETPHIKKKNKRANIDERTDKAQVNAVNEENGDTCTEEYNTTIIEDESSEVSPKKKKKKKVYIEESIEEHRDIEGFNVVEEENVKSSNKKKKRKLEDTEEDKDNTVLVNGVSVNETEDKNRYRLEGEKKKERKKKKNKRLEMEDGNHPSHAKDPGKEESTTPTVQKSKRGKSRIKDFTVIKEVKSIKKQRVERVLPEWLSNPTVVSMEVTDGVPITDLKGVDPYFMKWLEEEKITKFFPVQTAVIPDLLASSKSISMRYRPRDICVSAPTGCGKTLAYVLPIIQALRSRVVPRLRALVILPTRELAVQVHSVFVKFTRESKLKVCLAVANHSFRKEQEDLVFQDTIGDCAADILVSTPGKLSLHISRTDRLSFKYLRYLVFDEADLFLSSSGGNFMLKIEQLKKAIVRPTPDNSIISGGFQPSGSVHLPEPYLQQILISATLMHDPEQLKVLNLHRPKLFIASNDTKASGALGMVGPYMRPQEIREEYIIVDSTVKPLVLHHVIETKKWKSVLVFTKSTIATHTLSIVLSALSKERKVEQFSSKDKRRREEIVKDFSSKKIDVLVSSDAMARGIDISNIEVVVSYDVPSVQTYVHRIGRTGRAGNQGLALTLVENTPESKKDLSAILLSCRDRLHKINLNEKKLTKYEEQYQEALATLKKTTWKEKKKEKLNKIKKKINHARRLKEKKKLNRKIT